MKNVGTEEALALFVEPYPLCMPCGNPEGEAKRVRSETHDAIYFGCLHFSSSVWQLEAAGHAQASRPLRDFFSLEDMFSPPGATN